MILIINTLEDKQAVRLLADTHFGFISYKGKNKRQQTLV